MKLAIIIIISVLLLIFILSCVVAYFLCRYYARPRRRTHQEEIDRFRDMNLLFDYDKLKFEEFTLELRDKVKINGRIFNFHPGTDKYIILAHGFTVSQVSVSKYMEAYRDLGFNIVTYDERGQSENELATCGMSYYEGEDLVEVINYTKKRFGKDIKLGIHGESMGAASVLASLKFNPDINFAVADCPFAKLKLLSLKEAKLRYHVPRYIIEMCSFIGKIFFGYNPNKVNPIDGINNSKVPLLLCHGIEDKLIPYEHSKMVYDAYNSEKELFLTEGADHAQSITVDRTRYNNKIKEFVSKHI